ncbi:malonyl-CoA O-methyltransferase [Seinonella peptonophila]|uniref:Malonyl-CoA O-methyltransferase n=1 Tax=Seinonella peptonophila TaxID=112248 RepID=A0A1M4Z4Z6_9BACL|nr:methyltransferase domain-containing protein [Seinonella peptonophila]SHF12802.1 malonyl-CoA O-methyltransferase [Seinonella peptonophila]
MYKNQRLVQQFDQNAELYDQFSTVHQKMAYRMLELMKQIGMEANEILEIGCRTGYLTQLLLDHMQASSITAIDLSKRMMQIAHEKIPNYEQINWIHCDLEKIIVELEANQYDLLISNALIHWLDFPSRVFREWFDLLRPGGYLVLSTFGPETFQEFRFLFQQVEDQLGVPQAEHFLSFQSATEWKELLQSVGIETTTTMEHWIRHEAASGKEILRTIKGIGESGSCHNQSLYTSHRALTSVLERYSKTYRFRDGVYTTLQIILLVGYKPKSPTAVV